MRFIITRYCSECNEQIKFSADEQYKAELLMRIHKGTLLCKACAEKTDMCICGNPRCYGYALESHSMIDTCEVKVIDIFK